MGVGVGVSVDVRRLGSEVKLNQHFNPLFSTGDQNAHDINTSEEAMAHADAKRTKHLRRALRDDMFKQQSSYVTRWDFSDVTQPNI